MTILEAQREIRTGLMGGFMGQLVSGLLWLISAFLATWSTPDAAIKVVVIGGFFIFPLTTLGLRLIGRPSTVSKDNPFNNLGWQTAFVVPICLLVVGGATLYRLEWFYPALMIVVGAHYLPFATLYGMKMFLALAAILVGSGAVLALYLPMPFYAGAWFTAAVLMIFAVLGRRYVMKETSDD